MIYASKKGRGLRQGGEGETLGILPCSDILGYKNNNISSILASLSCMMNVGEHCISCLAPVYYGAYV